MLDKIKDHLMEFIIIVVVLSGILYSTTTTYKTSVKIDNIIRKIESNENKLKEISKNIAIRELKNGTLSPEDIKALMSDNEIREFELNFNASETR